MTFGSNALRTSAVVTAVSLLLLLAPQDVAGQCDKKSMKRIRKALGKTFNVNKKRLKKKDNIEYQAAAWLSCDPAPTSSVGYKGYGDVRFGERYAAYLLASQAGIPESWIVQSASACDWNGMTCDTDGFVTGINLSKNVFSGVIPSSISLFPKLRHLDLSYNNLNSVVPWGSIVPLQSLESINLEGNNFKGVIPWSEVAAGLTNLEVLNLSHNKFTGSIDSSINGLTKLRVLSLHANSMTGQPLADGHGLFDMIRLETLSLYKNGFTGTVSGDVSKLVNVKHLLLYQNRFSGKLPATANWSGMKKMERLWIHKNAFTGGAPASLCGLVPDFATVVEQHEYRANHMDFESDTGALWQLRADCKRDEMACTCCTSCFA